MRKVALIGFLVLAVICMACVSVLSIAGTPAQKQDATLEPLRALLSTPEPQLDLAKAKLTIDHMIDPTIDVPGTLKQLDILAAKIKARFPAGATKRAKVDILLSSLYEPGPWNDYRSFSYDLNDPFGKAIRNKLISTYLISRKGNCVSMPILFVILGQKLDLNVTLATAPEHLLVKFGDDEKQQWLNIEATAGGFKFDSSYERETGISPTAIENAIYLRPLSQRESVAIMMSTLMQFYGDQNQQIRRIAVADLALTVDPKDVAAMQAKGAAYYLLIQQRYRSKYSKAEQIPPDKRQDYLNLSRENLLWYAKAEALGWTEPTRTQDANYLKSIQREKAARQGAR